MKILILAIPIGTGHIKAANAIKQAIEDLTEKAIVRFEDCFKWVFPLYGYAYKDIYDFGQLHSHTLLKLLYRGMGVKTGGDRLLYLFHKKTAYRFRKLLNEFRPDYILSAHFSPTYYSALYKNEFNYQIGVVVTDYYVHPHWVNNEVDHYFIPHEDLTEQMLEYGARKEKIYPLGIAVNLALEDKIDKVLVRKRFNLSEEKISTVVMGSRVFGGEWYELVKEIADFDYNLLVLCGENKEVMRKLEKLKGKANLVTYGMVERIQELIAVCDILITKAGGITITEATKAGPCLLFANSIPGLEDKNEEFFIKHGAALKITEENAKKVLSDLISDAAKIKQMKENLKRLGKKDSALNIARTILGFGCSG